MVSCIWKPHSCCCCLQIFFSKFYVVDKDNHPEEQQHINRLAKALLVSQSAKPFFERLLWIFTIDCVHYINVYISDDTYCMFIIRDFNIQYRCVFLQMFCKAFKPYMTSESHLKIIVASMSTVLTVSTLHPSVSTTSNYIGFYHAYTK